MIRYVSPSSMLGVVGLAWLFVQAAKDPRPQAFFEMHTDEMVSTLADCSTGLHFPEEECRAVSAAFRDLCDGRYARSVDCSLDRPLRH